MVFLWTGPYRFRRWGSGAAAVLLVLGLVTGGCGDKGDDDDSAAGDDDSAGEGEDHRTPVQAVTVVRGPISETISSTSTIASQERADILVEVAGTVATVMVEEGATVAAGQLLAELKNPQLKGERERSEASYNRAAESFVALEALYNQGFLSRNEYDEAAHNFDTARLSVEQARDADAARSLRAPIAGTLSLRDLRFGEAVSPGRVAFQVVDLARLEVEVNLPERELSRLRVGQAARIRSEVLDGVEGTAEVLRISPVVDPASGTIKVTLSVRPGEAVLRPGMFVRVDLITDVHPLALFVPKKALVYDEGEPLLFLVREGAAVRQRVELGFAEEDQVEILSGVSEGDSVVVIGQNVLRDGAQVNVVD